MSNKKGTTTKQMSLFYFQLVNQEPQKPCSQREETPKIVVQE
jgi:hypothetical protein